MNWRCRLGWHRWVTQGTHVKYWRRYVFQRCARCKETRWVEEEL